MAFSTVILRAVGAVRAYFQRELNEQLMDFNDIPAAAVPVICQTYLSLSIVFGISAVNSNEVAVHLGISSRFVYDVLLEISIGLYLFRFALKYWARRFSFFYNCIILVCFLMIVEAVAPGFYRDYSPFYSRRIHMTSIWSMIYATMYSQVMSERIIRTRNIDDVNHEVCFFTDFPFVTFRVCRMMLREFGRRLSAVNEYEIVLEFY